MLSMFFSVPGWACVLIGQRKLLHGAQADRLDRSYNAAHTNSILHAAASSVSSTRSDHANVPLSLMLSMREYQRLTAEKGGFWQAYESFRRAVDLPKLKIEPTVFEGLRDRSAGREIRL